MEGGRTQSIVETVNIKVAVARTVQYDISTHTSNRVNLRLISDRVGISLISTQNKDPVLKLKCDRVGISLTPTQLVNCEGYFNYLKINT